MKHGDAGLLVVLMTVVHQWNAHELAYVVGTAVTIVLGKLILAPNLVRITTGFIYFHLHIKKNAKWC